MGKEYENIFITKDAPLVVRNETDAMHYGTVYMEEGAYIELCVGKKFVIEELQFLNDVSKSIQENCVSYPTLLFGESSREWEGYDIIVTTLSGKDGERGTNGGIGGGVGQRGTSGTDAAKQTRKSFDLVIKELGKNIKVLSVGGSGGNGGNAGNGGDGWDGTSKMDKGTIGGNGGNAGNAGNGGAASDAVENLYVQWNSEENYEITVDCKIAKGGKGGIGGQPGKNGEFYEGVKQPMRGANGNSGADGKRGTWERKII